MERHPLGQDWGAPERRCGECAWARPAGPGPKVLRCQASGGRRVEAGWRSCARWEGPLDCLACAACCGPAYDAVEVSPRDPVRKAQPGVAVQRDGRWQIPRTEDNFCSMLLPDNRCTIYADRPRCCR